MRQFQIRVGSFADIQSFVSLAIAQPFDVQIDSNGCLINAKSLMAMFGLNFRRPLTVQVVCEEAAFLKFREDAARFLAV